MFEIEKIAKGLEGIERSEDFLPELEKLEILYLPQDIELHEAIKIVEIISEKNFPAGLFLSINWGNQMSLREFNEKTYNNERLILSNLKPNGKIVPFLERTEKLAIIGEKNIKLGEKQNVNFRKINSLSLELYEIDDKKTAKSEGDFYEITANPYSYLSNIYLFIGSAILGRMKEIFRMSLNYSNERIQGGKPIISYFAIKEKIFKILEFIEVVDSAISEIAKTKDKSKSIPKIVYLTKYIVRESVLCSSESIQIFGGYGYMKDFKVEKFFRETETIKNLLELEKQNLPIPEML
ncbi:Cyclohexane-1-carbonyl-CoA dehydrogenase [bacterium HR19]|nr:Cyclohexane-1-carbonyl-CoA dehydrogenase [bacterium HR19]